MCNAIVSQAYRIFLIALEGRIVVLLSPHPLFIRSSITSCCETKCNSIRSSAASSWRSCSTSSSISLPSTSIPLILAKDTVSLTIDSRGLSQTQCHIRQHSPAKVSTKRK
ncbi:hypothetical protein AVEN_81329-1 [Araneus ventricosus]|uniref:Uncharacterized protein n=1 Tax=Araneus ventricosus TaxID=182803 RepID=A0A4Y2B8V1_ARAVE|nr:hypothetical protein AVEN_81329-1 [Araneus ventricosus]